MERKNIENRSHTYSIYVIAGLGLILFFSLFKSLNKVKNAQKQITDAQEKIVQLQKDQAELDKQLNSVEQGSYIEEQLRDKLGLAREGEIVIVMPSPEIVRKFAPVYPKEEEKLPDPNWLRWVKLFTEK